MTQLQYLCTLAGILLFCSLQSALVSNVNLALSLEDHVAKVDKNFLSITVSAGAIRHKFRRLNLTSLKIITLARGLNGGRRTPQVYLRFGGTLQDHYFFDDPSQGNLASVRSETLFTINSSEIQTLCAFAREVGWKLVVGLNSLLRRSDGAWDPTNAISLMNYAKKIGCVMQFELGNEPDLYLSQHNITIDPSKLAKDFVTLRRIIDNVMGKHTALFGPDIATLTRHEYFSRFLSAVPSNILSAVTFHHYYSSSFNISVQNFTSIPYLDTFIAYCRLAKSIIKRSFEGKREPPVWIGETSSTYGGGCRNTGQTFAAGFLWLDKLGLAAQFNISVVIRQSIKGGWYSLLTKSSDPTPDYWSSVIYKRLVGQVVLNITGFLEPGRAVRVYAHCAVPDYERKYRHGDVVLIALNVDKRPAHLHLSGILDVITYAYLLTPASGNLDDKSMRLNGHVLKLKDDETLPDIRPVRVNLPLQLPSFSYGFFVVTMLRAKACIR